MWLECSNSKRHDRSERILVKASTSKPDTSQSSIREAGAARLGFSILHRPPSTTPLSTFTSVRYAQYLHNGALAIEWSLDPARRREEEGKKEVFQEMDRWLACIQVFFFFFFFFFILALVDDHERAFARSDPFSPLRCRDAFVRFFERRPSPSGDPISRTG